MLALCCMRDYGLCFLFCIIFKTIQYFFVLIIKTSSIFMIELVLLFVLYKLALFLFYFPLFISYELPDLHNSQVLFLPSDDPAHHTQFHSPRHNSSAVCDLDYTLQNTPFHFLLQCTYRRYTPWPFPIHNKQVLPPLNRSLPCIKSTET